MNSVVLVIIYNHQFNKNIDILEKIYSEKFSDIFHIVPFYSGNKSNVIPVYECSYYFQGYISQSFKSFYNEKFQHYIFVADDMIINPNINQNNYKEHLCLTNNDNYIPFLNTLHSGGFWSRNHEAMHWNISPQGIEAKDQIPNYRIAKTIFEKFNITIKPLKYHQVFHTNVFKHNYGLPNILAHLVFQVGKLIFSKKKYHLPYPFVGSYSDFFVVNSQSIKNFCHISGVFSATKLFVELAIPTALVLSSENIVCENNLKIKGRTLWNNEDYKELDKYSLSIKNLLTTFPDEYLYIHPIKLSKWKIDF